MTPELETKFWKYVDHAGADECWQWIGSLGQNGYGNFAMDGKNIRAHKMSWLLHYGPVPAGMYVCHHCDNPSCVNPAHLFIGTPRDNYEDMWKKGRSPRKLTDEDVLAIYQLRAGHTDCRIIARQYGVSAGLIRSICRCDSYRHIARPAIIRCRISRRKVSA